MSIRVTLAAAAASALAVALAPQAMAQYPTHQADGHVHGSPSRAAVKNLPKPDSSEVDAHIAKAPTHNPLFIIETRAEGVGATLDPYAFVNMDAPQKFVCKAVTCTVIISSDVQVTASADGGNWAIVGYVDGNYVTNSAYYLGVINIADGYVTGNSRQTVTVAQGTHILQSAVIMNGGGYLSQYQIDYEVTTP